MCEFSISAPGVLHLSTLLIGSVCIMLGFMTHLHSSWLYKQTYKLCEAANWKEINVDCPDISLEAAFLIVSVLCLMSSFIWYSCHCFCFGNSRTAAVFYVIYLALAAVTLVIAGVLYIKSAMMIPHLPEVEYSPVLHNMGRVVVAAFRSDNSDDMQLTPPSMEQTYYQEKLATGVLTILNGVLHIMIAWLAVLDFRNTHPRH